MRLFEFNSSAQKVILTDVDGVLLNHMDGIVQFFHKQGHPTLPGMENEYGFTKRFGIHNDRTIELVKAYNSSDKIESLPPLPGAVSYVQKLASEGYIFQAITAVSDRGDVCDMRRRNLQDVFGKSIFPDNRVTCIGIGKDLKGASKTPQLAKYAGTGYYWIDDKPMHVEEGLAQGLTCMLYTNAFTPKDFNPEGVTRVSNWKDIYAFIKENEKMAALGPEEQEPELEPPMEPDINKGQDDVNRTDQIEPDTGEEREEYNR